VGLIEEGQAEIREGLAEGEMVVARAGAFVREGDRVRPVAADEAPSRQ
jgi:HlyD family secretion protein